MSEFKDVRYSGLHNKLYYVADKLLTNKYGMKKEHLIWGKY